MPGKTKSYRLGEHDITERYGAIWWKAHAGFGTIRRGKCFIEGNILFLDAHCETDESTLLKNEFLESLRKLPKWDRTKFYCTRFAIHECSTTITSKSRSPSQVIGGSDFIKRIPRPGPRVSIHAPVRRATLLSQVG